jgi:hypothetical protein
MERKPSRKMSRKSSRKSSRKNTKRRPSRKMSRSCPKGQILREGYYRKAHSRKAYTKNGNIPSSYVDKTYVPPTCVADIGKPGKTPQYKRVLPKPTKNVLGPFGYSIDKAIDTRHRALKRASKYYNPLEILRHLNLIRNYQPKDSRAEKIMSKDVDFMSKYYEKWKNQ